MLIVRWLHILSMMLKFRVGNGVRNLESENIFAKACTPN